MKAAFIASILAVCFTSATHGKQNLVECNLQLQSNEDLRSFLFSRAAQSLSTNANIAPDVIVTAELGDDYFFNGQRFTQPVVRLMEIMRPANFRQKRAKGIVRVSGDPCREHELSFEATTTDASEVWTIDIRFDAGIIHRVHAAQYYYEEARSMEQVNG